MKIIEKIKLKNFKRFTEASIALHDEVNLLIGDNESGKSTILTAIDLVLSGSRSKFENLGINNIFNIDAVDEFLSGTRDIQRLPELYIELYFSERHNPILFGRNNSDNRDADGLTLACKLDDDYSAEVKSALTSDPLDFPFEYYKVSFHTFQGDAYSGHRRFLRHIYIDNSQMSSDYAMRQYIGDVYDTCVDQSTNYQIRNGYRRAKNKFAEEALKLVNDQLDDYQFVIRSDSKSNLDHDLTLKEGRVPIEYKGKGKQCFVKTDFAMRKDSSRIDIVLLEEPENHLSHVNTRRLVEKIAANAERQVFVATHNNLIAARLNLQKLIVLDATSQEHLYLSDLSDDTAEFFVKAPDHNVLEFVLSKKVILVEGDAEYILLDRFFRDTKGHSADFATVNIISVDGLSFKRYLDIAVKLKIKVAVLRDNDKQSVEKIQEDYSQYLGDHIQVFCDTDPDRSTFEICLYRDNSVLLDALLGMGRRTRSVQEYMLAEKSEAALKILRTEAGKIIIPDYIKRAIEWISA